MQMKLFHTAPILLTFAVLLSSCFGAVTAPASAPIPTFTRTPPATNTPTITPSPSATPPPTPVGATSFDSASGRYVKADNGRTFYWMPLQINAADSQEGHWFELRNLNDLPLLDHVVSYFPSDKMFMEVLVLDDEALQNSSSEMYLHHPDSAPLYKADGDRVGSFCLELLHWLFLRTYGEGSDPKFRSQFKMEHYADFRDELDRGSLSLPFTTPTGDYVYEPFKRGVYRVLVVPWEASDPAKDPRFMEYWGGDHHGRSMTLGDADGNLLVVIASKEPINLLSDKKVLGFLLVPLIRVLLSEDQSEEYYINEVRYQFINKINLEILASAGSGPASDPTHHRYIEIVRDR